MRRKLALTLLCFFTLASATMITASADFGPKPSVVVRFTGLEQENCFVTLLSKTPSTGPYSADNYESGYARYKEGDADFEIWEKFVSYEDEDGFYFLQFFQEPDKGRFAWTYYPPEEFKILVYFPQEDSFAVSGEIYSRYAFDSYYTADASGLGAHPAGGAVITAVRSYDYSHELAALIARIVLTVAIELAIALPFGFTAKKQLLIIVLANAVTQTVLSVLLFVIHYKMGRAAFIFNYVWLELLVFAIEAALYAVLLKRWDKAPERKRRPVLYAFTANAASFALGLVTALVIPQIF